MKTSKRNGKIELARFVFSMIVILFHIGGDLLPKGYHILGEITFFGRGYFGVEFFFVVSGYLMAASAFKTQEKKLPLGKDTFYFLRGKVLAVLPTHLIVFFVTFVYVVITKVDSLDEFIKYSIGIIPNFLLIQRSGLYFTDVLGIEWYISQMIMAMFILYPLCKKYYEKFTRIVAPIVALLIIGYIIKTTGRLSGATAWSVLVSKTLLRAVAEISAGAFTFELTRNVKKLKFTKSDKIFLTALEVYSYLMVLLFIIYDFDGKYGGTFIIFACIAVSLSFSEITYGKSLFNNKVVYFLGSLSLPVYLCQSLPRRFINTYTESMWVGNRILLFTALTLAFALIVLPLEKILRKAINQKIEKLTPKNTD